MNEIVEPVLTLCEAKYLMEILDNDIPPSNKHEIALLLLILVANPSLVKENEKIVTSAFGRTAHDYNKKWENGENGEYWGEYY